MTLLSIHLEEGFVPKIKIGDDVSVGQVIAEKIVENDEKGDLGKLLDVSPAQALRYLTKRPGDRVEKGTIVALKKGALGIGAKKVASPIAGTVFKFDEETGFIYIRGNRENAQTENLFSPVDGAVELCDNKKIVIRTQKSAILADRVSGKASAQAELILIDKAEVDPQEDLDKKINGKIVLGRFFNREALSKSIGLGASGLISKGIKDEDLDELTKKMIETPVFIVSDKDFEKLAKYNGKKIYIDCEKKVIIIL